MASLEWLPTYVGDAYELLDAYADFWKRVGRLASKPVRPAALKVEPVREVEGESLRINIGRAEPLAILGVPSGGVRGTNGFDVYLSGTQVVRKVKGACDDEHIWITVKSEFEILYLNALENSEARTAWRRNEKISTAFVGYQFVVDTATHCRAHYPDCHARYSLDVLKESAIQRLYRDDDDSWACRATHGRPIVPSAPLDLVGLLYVVLHQHDPSGVSNGWPRDMKDVLARLPTFRLDLDERSSYGRWYEHSHSTPDDAPWDSPKRQLDSFNVPKVLAADGWGARIAGRERNETPHLSVNHGKERKRVNLRTGEFMDGDRNWIPPELWKEIERTLPEWGKLWDVFYGKENPVGERPK